jgi:hypothetical protein
MSSDLKRFILRILIAASVLVFLGWVVFSFITPEHYLPVLPYVLAFFIVVTILFHAFQLRLAKKDFPRFTRNSLMISMFRLILYSVVTIVCMANSSGNIGVLVVSIVLIYLVFTFIEVADLSRFVRNKKK